jgi:hypothetical protein
MQGKLKDASVYFRVRSSWPSSLYVARGKKKNQKTVREAGAKGRRYSS